MAERALQVWKAHYVTENHQPRTTAVVKSPSDRASAAIFGVMAALAIVSAILNHTLWSYLIGVVGLTVFSLGTWRSLRARIVAGPTGLVAYQVGRRSIALDWSRVVRFDYRGSLRGIGAWRSDGQWVRLQNWGAVYRSRANEVVGQLEAVRSRATQPDIS